MAFMENGFNAAYTLPVNNCMKKIVPKSLLRLAKYGESLFLRSFPPQKMTAREFSELSALKGSVAYNRFGGYFVPSSSSHRPAASVVLGGGVYEHRTIDFMRRHYQSGDIIHAGTYFGDFIPALSQLIAPDATLWAFEPNHENFLCAEITLQINRIGNVIITNAALGDRNEHRALQSMDEQGRSLGGASRLVRGHSTPDTHCESAQIVRIDDVVPEDRKIAIIHLDVDGYEREALIGALTTVRTHLPTLILEDLSESTLLESAWFSDNILSLGYTLTCRIDNNAVFEWGSKS